MTVPLLHRPVVRAGWLTVGAVCAFFAAGAAWAAWEAGIVATGRVLAFVLALGYAWLADGAFRLARARPVLALSHDAVTLGHTPLLPEPTVVPASGVSAVTVDRRPFAERRVAAATRAPGVAPSGFLDPRLPVVSVAPSAHWPEGSGAPPNVVLWLDPPASVPTVPRSVRLLLRVAGGRSGRYLGPRPGRPFTGVRLVVADDGVPAVVAWAAERGLLAELDRDRRYLAALTERNRRSYVRGRWVMVGIVLGVGLLGMASRCG